MAVRTAYSIGFTKHSARDFFESLNRAGIERLVDVRLNNVSQLAGFAKRDDLAYFLELICGVEYMHEPLLAPTAELLDAYRKRRITWETYERRFSDLIRERSIGDMFAPEFFDRRTVLLCSEHAPDQCHRRLVLEYLQRVWEGDLVIKHL
ncbi:MAG: DUF488 domain-containing protein [Chloroflexi bacterium]|nr:DUF488 domain-containing protein [Chloroflexota bacterium]